MRIEGVGIVLIWINGVFADAADPNFVNFLER
jgi:hypothetical protein